MTIGATAGTKAGGNPECDQHRADDHRLGHRRSFRPD